MKKLLTICPTRERIKLCKEMYQSFINTSGNSDIIFMVDNDDKYLHEYLDFFNQNSVQYNKNERQNTTKLFNQAFKSFPDYQFYCMTNDDFVFHTPKWDRILCQKRKICYGDDLCARDTMPTCPVIDGDIVRAVGWLQMPELTYMYGDTVWKMIGNTLGILKYFPNVIIEHCHWLNHKSEIDDVYKNTNSAETYQRDEMAYRVWKLERMGNDIKKIKEALNGI